MFPLARLLHCLPASLLAVASIVSAAAAPLETWPDFARSQSLNGRWEFSYRAGPMAAPQPTLSSVIAVPGHWELQGFAEPQYGRNLAEGTGYYRRTFRVPPDWAGQRVMLRFEGVLSGFEAIVNGESVGSWTSGFNPATFDVTEQLRADVDNELLVIVSTRSHGWEFDTNDCWSLSGIYRDVTLFAVPPVHLKDFTVQTTGGDKERPWAIRITAATSAACDVTGVLKAPNGLVLEHFGFPTSPGDKYPGSASIYVRQPELWTAETPVLYTLELTLSSGQKITEKIGLRQVAIVDGVLQLNGRPIKLRGVNHHDIWPDSGRATDEAKIRRDLELIQAANCNFVRTSHYPPHPRLLELCDELGLYVMDEVPFGFGEDHLKDPAYQDELLRRARATVQRDRNHPSVLIWSVGNENENTPLTFATARRVKELDPSRPVCFPQIGSYFATSYRDLPADIDIYAPHYPTNAIVRDYASRLTRPVIFTEYAHALGLATDQVQVQWPMMQSSRHIAGGAIWMFQDQGILRAARPGETPATSHALGLNVWPDTGRYYDSHGNQGMDGLVYSDRTPQTDYWLVRKVYSPVQIAPEHAAMRTGANRIVLPVENRFDFRSLDGIRLAWSLMRNGTQVEKGTVPLRAPARSTEEIAIEITLPTDADADVFTLELQAAESGKQSFYERTLRLDLPAEADRAGRLVAAGNVAPLTLSESPDTIAVGHPTFRLTLQRPTGELRLSDPAGNTLASGFLPHVGRRLTEGEFVRRKTELTWTTSRLPAAPGLEVSALREGDHVVLRLHGRYPRPEMPEEGLEGDITIRVRSNGSIDVGYDFTAVKSQGLILEAGLSLLVPAGASEFRWLGAGPHAGYPDKSRLNEFGLFHLGRDDLRFQGNRRSVELALLTSPTGGGVALGGREMDVAVEREEQLTVLSHNAVLSGRGTKFHAPDLAINAEEWPRIQGQFTVIPLAAPWPSLLTKWFGAPKAAEVFRPFAHSYDQ